MAKLARLHYLKNIDLCKCSRAETWTLTHTEDTFEIEEEWKDQFR